MRISVFRDGRLGRERIGVLSGGTAPGDASFVYDADYLNMSSESSLGISERLPLRPEPYSADEVSPFFQGLLPEGEIIANLAQLYQVPRSNWVALIGNLGCESIGGLTFINDSDGTVEVTPRYSKLSPEDRMCFLKDPARAATIAASSTRLSLSGAQTKVAWTLPEDIDAAEACWDDWLVPEGTAASTHIIKVSRRGEEDLAFNEMACSELARACGIEVAKVVSVPSIPGAIAVSRYDRRWVSDALGQRFVVRMHQEDFCQGLGLAPFYKYQPEGVDANYIELCAQLIDDTSQNPGADRLEWAKRLVFNFVVGNSDSHLKNSSLLYNEGWTARRLAPMYDVTCIPLTGYSTAMPFTVGKHRELEEIDEFDILSVSLSADVEYSAFAASIESIVAALGASDVLGAVGPEASDCAKLILDNAEPRLRVLDKVLERWGTS